MGELYKKIYWENLTIMKKILSLYEYKVGKGSEDYKYFKQEVMSFFYDELNRFYNDLVRQGIVEKCDCGASLRKGYKPCEDCGGSGFRKNK